MTIGTAVRLAVLSVALFAAACGGGASAPPPPAGCTSPAQCPGSDATCSVRTCAAGVCGTSDAAPSTACTEDGGQVCDGAGACVTVCALSSPCSAPPGFPPACFGEIAVTYPSAGTCSYAAVAPGYTCTYLSSQVDCAATGLVCQGGVCLAPPPPPPSEQLQAIRDAAAACASSYCPSSLAVNGAVVTYLRPAIGNEPAGFYLQADAAGPALLVEVDPATVGTTGLAVGNRVSLTVTRVSTWSGAVFAELISGFSRQARGVDVAPLVQDLSAAGDIVSALDSYADELVTVEGALSGSSVAAGTGFVQFPLETAGYPSGSANLRLRAASTVLDALDLVWGCTLVAGPAPLGRLGGTAQPTARAAGEVTLTGCPAPLVVAAIATGTAEVRITLDRRIDPASVLADGSQVAFTGGLVALAASASGRELTVVTSSQIPGTTYTATVAGTVTDQVGTGVALGARTASFVGYVVPAVLRLTELAPTIDSSRDLVELLVISGGRTGGGRLVELGTATKVLATLPDVTVATGDSRRRPLRAALGCWRQRRAGGRDDRKGAVPRGGLPELRRRVGLHERRCRHLLGHRPEQSRAPRRGLARPAAGRGAVRRSELPIFRLLRGAAGAAGRGPVAPGELRRRAVHEPHHPERVRGLRELDGHRQDAGREYRAAQARDELEVERGLGGSDLDAGRGERPLTAAHRGAAMARARHTGVHRPHPLHAVTSTTSASPPASEMAGQQRRRQAPHRLQRSGAMTKARPARGPANRAAAPARDGTAGRHRARMRGCCAASSTRTF